MRRLLPLAIVVALAAPAEASHKPDQDFHGRIKAHGLAAVACDLTHAKVKVYRGHRRIADWSVSYGSVDGRTFTYLHNERSFAIRFRVDC